MIISALFLVSVNDHEVQNTLLQTTSKLKVGLLQILYDVMKNRVQEFFITSLSTFPFNLVVRKAFLISA